MEWLFAVVVVAVLGAVAVVAAGRGEPMDPAEDDVPASGLPADRPLGPADLRGVRFPLAVRGYRMAEVDALLCRVVEEWERAQDRQGEREHEQDERGRGELPHRERRRADPSGADPGAAAEDDGRG